MSETTGPDLSKTVSAAALSRPPSDSQRCGMQREARQLQVISPTRHASPVLLASPSLIRCLIRLRTPGFAGSHS